MRKSEFLRKIHDIVRKVQGKRFTTEADIKRSAVDHARNEGIDIADQTCPVIELIVQFARARTDFMSLRVSNNPDISWLALILIEEAWEYYQTHIHPHRIDI